MVDLFPICFRFIYFFFCSHDLEVTERVLQQRITHIEDEYQQNYNDAKEQLKNDSRLTVDAILQQQNGKNAKE